MSAVVFLGGAVGAPIAMVLMMLGQLESGDEFFVPGTHALKVAKPGKHVVWNVVSEFRDGRQYSFTDDLPAGTHIRVVDDSTGKEIPTEAVMHATESSGSAKRTSVCSFRVPAAGAYSVIVDGTSEQRLLLVRHSMASRLVWLFVVGGVVSVIGWVLAPAISILIEVRRYRARKEAVAGGIQTMA